MKRIQDRRRATADGLVANDKHTPINKLNSPGDAKPLRKRRVFGGVTHDEHANAIMQWGEVRADDDPFFERVALGIASDPDPATHTPVAAPKRTPADLRKLDKIIKAQRLIAENLAKAREDKD